MAADIFSREWFEQNFARTQTKQSELVSYLNQRGINIDATKISKTVTGRRQAQSNERLPIWEFFGYHPNEMWEALTQLHPHAKKLPQSFGDDTGDKNSRRLPLPNAGLPEKIKYPVGQVPILGRSVGGNNRGMLLFNGVPLGFVSSPGTLANNPRAYATYVHGDSMEPRYEAGEIVLVNPDKGYRKGNYVVAQVHDNDDDPPFGYVKKFISFSDELILEQLNPAEGEDKIMRFPREQVVSVHRIVGTLDE